MLPGIPTYTHTKTTHGLSPDYLRIIVNTMLIHNVDCRVYTVMYACACFQFSCSTQDTDGGLMPIIHLITIQWLLTNNLKIKLCRRWLGKLGTKLSGVTPRLIFLHEIAESVLYLLLSAINFNQKIFCLNLHSYQRQYEIFCYHFRAIRPPE